MRVRLQSVALGNTLPSVSVKADRETAYAPLNGYGDRRIEGFLQ